MRFVPHAFSTEFRPGSSMLRWLELIAEDAWGANGSGNDSLSTECDDVNAYRGPVPPHVDHMIGSRCKGILVYGLVLKSEGHRLHTRILEDMGLADGIPLESGTFYVLDPWDMHWTSCPDPKGDLIFTHESFVPDGRSHEEIIEAMWAGVIESHALFTSHPKTPTL